MPRAFSIGVFADPTAFQSAPEISQDSEIQLFAAGRSPPPPPALTM